jgi:hypothetical protein
VVRWPEFVVEATRIDDADERSSNAIITPALSCFLIELLVNST